MEQFETTKVGVIGCGNISDIYFKAPERFSNIEITACADLDIERARTKAEKFKIPNAGTIEELLADPDISIVANLTPPQAHYDVSRMILESGKHVYSEKPMAIDTFDADTLLGIAANKGLRFGGAPDTFLGGGLQTCRKIIDDGLIGEPVAATATMAYRGVETWGHPAPAAFYKEGAGPLFDMGPYYITALTSMIGRIARVNAMSRITFPNRKITNPSGVDDYIEVTTPTHISGNMEFENQAIATIITSFDVWGTNLPRLEIYGTEGSLSMPDPNTFGGPVKIRRSNSSDWENVPLTHGFTENSRGLGISDMADAIKNNAPHRANGKLTFHTLEVMEGLLEAARSRQDYEVRSGFDRPAALKPLAA